LLHEGESLRAHETQQSSAPAAPTAAKVKVEENSFPTTLIFRDGTRKDVQNYAILGKAIWIFSEQRARKVPVSELDVEATRKANEEHGLDFSLPQ
jgi:hypothetical protein